jgi:hypothetical protein
LGGLKYFGPIEDEDDIATKGYVDSVSTGGGTGGGESLFEYDENNDLMPKVPSV